VFYYVTMMNENYAHPAMPEGVEEGILKGMYRIRPSTAKKPAARAQLLGSGAILREVLAAAQLLEQDWKVGADVWSVTSFTELRRDGMTVERRNRFNPEHDPELSWVERCLNDTQGPVIASTDYMRAVADMIRTWVPRRYVTLGTDGFGRSDTRAALRDFFEVDRHHVVIAALKALADEGSIERKLVSDAIAKYGIGSDRPNPWDV
jgi:pyruvate dehydrogenase E1 component